MLSWTSEHLYFQATLTSSSQWEVFFSYCPSRSPLSGAVRPQKLTSWWHTHIIWNISINQALFFFSPFQVTCLLGLPYESIGIDWVRVNASVGDTPPVWAPCSINVLVPSRPLNDEVLKNEEWEDPFLWRGSSDNTQPRMESSGGIITCRSVRNKPGLFLKGKVINWQIGHACVPEL